MKNIIYLVLLMIAFTSCQNQAKIGYVDNGKIINDYQMKKDLEARFQITEQSFRKKFDSIENSFQFQAQKFQEENTKMAPAKAQEVYQQLSQQRQMIDQQKQVEAQQFQQAFQTEIDTIIVKIKDYVKDYGKKNGYEYI